jgi:putative transposase
MYSYEDRIRAVRPYVKLVRRVAATIRQLGYPTRNALKSWHTEFELRLDLLHTFEAKILKRAEETRRRTISRAWPLHPRATRGMSSRTV